MKLDSNTYNAVPLDENILNGIVIYVLIVYRDSKGVTFESTMYCDQEYPVLPSKVKLCTTIQHPNVLDEWTCLDVIKREQPNKY